MRLRTILISILLLMISFNIDKVHALNIDKNEINIGIGYRDRLHITDSSSNKIIWSSTNESVAVVDNGVVVAKGIGSSFIIAYDGKNSVICEVNVIENYIPVDSISLSKNSDILYIGETKKINAFVLPTNATNKKIMFTSINPDIAKVDENGNVTGISSGVTYISLMIDNKSLTYKIEVKPQVYNSKNSIISSNLELFEGKSGKLTLTQSVLNSTSKKLIFKSSNTNVATVDSNGIIKALTEGNSTITVISEEGSLVAVCKLTVKKENSNIISINKDDLTLEIGKIEKLKVLFNSKKIDEKNISWSSSDSSIATVKDGVVTAIKPGNVEIKATSSDGKYEAVSKVKVSSQVNNDLDKDALISISGYDFNFNKDVKTYKLYIEDEDSLDIKVDLDSSKYTIGGNHDLKNGSIITISLDNPDRITYVIKIIKNDPTIFIIIILALLSINVVRILTKNKVL